jgi:hypothetical protein
VHLLLQTIQTHASPHNTSNEIQITKANAVWCGREPQHALFFISIRLSTRCVSRCCQGFYRCQTTAAREFQFTRLPFMTKSIEYDYNIACCGYSRGFFSARPRCFSTHAHNGSLISSALSYQCSLRA